MRQQTKVQLEMVAKSRSEQMGRSSPGLEVRTVMDDSGLRCALQVLLEGQLVRLEFIESELTAGQQKFFDDYIEVASNTGHLVLLFPESKYPREIASAIYQGIMAQVRSRSRCQVNFQGFVYDDRGTIKKVD